tara:strand:- start:4 stop:213 length:210 start_codon:yes stop_codon:yes gene_type:complete
MKVNKKSEQYLSAKETLPKNLHPIYDQLVEEHMFYTEKRYGRGYVAYHVLADLVRDGWRPPERAEDTNS